MVQAIIFGIIGFFSCFLLEYLSSYFTKKKCRVHEIDIERARNFQKLRYVFYALNVVLWGFVGFQVRDYIFAFLISILFSLAILISMIDLRIHIIPNEFVLTMLLTGVVLKLLSFDLKNILIAVGCMVGTGAIFLILGLLLGIRKIGAGDIKLVAVMGFVLGYPEILTALLTMSISILVYCFIGFARYKLSMKSMLPYAPFLMIGMVSSLIFNTVV